LNGWPVAAMCCCYLWQLGHIARLTGWSYLSVAVARNFANISLLPIDIFDMQRNRFAVGSKLGTFASYDPIALPLAVSWWIPPVTFSSGKFLSVLFW